MSTEKKTGGLAGIVAGQTAISTVGKEGVGLTYRGYSIEGNAQARGWSVEVHPNTPDLPILRRAVFRVIHPAWSEALLEAHARIDGMLP